MLWKRARRRWSIAAKWERVAKDPNDLWHHNVAAFEVSEHLSKLVGRGAATFPTLRSTRLPPRPYPCRHVAHRSPVGDGGGRASPRISLQVSPCPSAAGLEGSLLLQRFCQSALPLKDRALNPRRSQPFSPFPSFHLSTGLFTCLRRRRAVGRHGVSGSMHQKHESPPVLRVSVKPVTHTSGNMHGHSPRSRAAQGTIFQPMGRTFGRKFNSSIATAAVRTEERGRGWRRAPP